MDDSGVPSSRTSPVVGLSRPPRGWRGVDFPDPDGPITETNRPAGTSSETPSRARRAIPGYSLEMSRAERIGSTMVSRSGGHDGFEARRPPGREAGGDDGDHHGH